MKEQVCRRVLSSPRLVPVVEVAPYRFPGHLPTPEYPYSDGAWEEYWKASLKASGFSPLEPLFPGSFFVRTTELTCGDCLDIIIARELEDVELDDDDDLPLSLDGGYVLYDSDEIVALPQCCGRLKDLADWREACEAKELIPGFWIGIGHPGLGVQVNEKILSFRSDGPEEIHIEPFECSQAVLGEQVQLAQKEVEAFYQRLLVRAQNMVGSSAKEICDGLVGKLCRVHEDGW